MLARDLSSGRLISVPDNHVFASPPGGYRLGFYTPGLTHSVGSVSGFGHYGAPPAQFIYDGLGHPLGLSFLTALPALAGRVAALLPQVSTAASKVLPLLQTAAATPQGQFVAMPAPDMMVSPSMPPPMQPSMQAPMESPIQPTMAPAMQEPMLPPMPASAQSPMPPSMAPLPPPEPGSAETVAPAEPFVAPLRVQPGDGGRLVMPMRWRVRRRRRGRRFVPMQLAVPQRPRPPSGYAPGSAAPAPYLHGWCGFNGWSRY
jgi:hypothetical protein